MRMPHTACRRSKRIRLVLRDGSRLDGRFLGRSDRWVDVDVGGGRARRVMKRDAKAFIILKGDGGGGRACR